MERGGGEESRRTCRNSALDIIDEIPGLVEVLCVVKAVLLASEDGGVARS